MKTNILGILIFFLLSSCIKEDTQKKKIIDNDIHTEKIKEPKHTVYITYKNNKPSQSVSYDIVTNKKKYDFLYNDDGIMIYSANYFKNGEVRSTLEIDSIPNYYLYKGYYPNGNYESVGGIDMVRKKPIKSGSWIFYNEDGTIYSTAEYNSDKKGNERLINEKIISKRKQLRITKDGKIVDDNIKDR